MLLGTEGLKSFGLCSCSGAREPVAVVTGSSSAAPAMQPPERVLPRLCPGLPTERQLRQEGAPEGRWMSEVLTVQLLPLPRLDGGGTSRDDAI